MMSTTLETAAETAPAATRTEAKTRPAPYVYRPDQGLPLPPETTDAKVLGRLAAIRGKASVDELGAALAVLDTELKTRYRAMAAAGKIGDHYPVVLDVLARRSIYAVRMTALRRALGMQPGAIPPAELPDLLRIVGDGHETDIRTRLDVVSTEIKAELQETDEALQAIERIAADETRYRTEGGYRGTYRGDRETRLNQIKRGVADLIAHVRPSDNTRRRGLQSEALMLDVEWIERSVRETTHADLEHEWPQDGLLRRLDAALTRRQALQTRLAALQQDTTRATSVVSAGVWDAVKAAGGKDVLIGGILAAQHLVNAIPPVLGPALQAIRRLETEHGQATDQFSRVSLALGDQFAPAAAEKLRGKQTELGAALQHARTALVTQQTELAASLVDDATSGIEPARAALQAIADRAPEAFAPGLGSALAASEFSAAAALALADALAN